MNKMLSNAKYLRLRGIHSTPPFLRETSPIATCIRISQIFHFENPQQQSGIPSSVIAIRSDFSMRGPHLWNGVQKADTRSNTKHGLSFHILLDQNPFYSMNCNSWQSSWVVRYPSASGYQTISPSSYLKQFNLIGYFQLFNQIFIQFMVKWKVFCYPFPLINDWQHLMH